MWIADTRKVKTVQVIVIFNRPFWNSYKIWQYVHHLHHIMFPFKIDDSEYFTPNFKHFTSNNKCDITIQTQCIYHTMLEGAINKTLLYECVANLIIKLVNSIIWETQLTVFVVIDFVHVSSAENWVMGFFLQKEHMVVLHRCINSLFVAIFQVQKEASE